MSNQSQNVRKGIKLIEKIIETHQFEDYYQLYLLIRDDAPLEDMIDGVIKNTGDKLLKRSVYILLTNGRNYEMPEVTSATSYGVSPIDIQEYIKAKLLENKKR